MSHEETLCRRWSRQIRAVPVGVGRPTGRNGAHSTQVAARAPSPKVIHTHFNATTMRDDSRLIIISLIVAGVKRPLRKLLDSGASNNFFRASCWSLLPSTVTVREGPGDIVVKLADGQPKRVPRKTVVLPYTFDGFQSNDEFLVYEMNYAFDCILGIPWLSRYQPKIDWLSRSVKRRSGYDVSEVFTHLLVASSDWPHVRVVNELATTSSQHRESDGPLCVVCSVTLTEPQNEAVEQRFPHTQTSTSVEQGLPIHNEAVEQGLPHTSTSDEQRLPINFEAVEQGLLRLISRRSSRGSLNTSEAVEEELSLLSDVNGRTMDPHETDVVKTELPRLEGVERTPCTAADITSLPDLAWKDFLHDLKAGDIEQVCIVSATEAASEEVLESRSQRAEPKSVREERLAARSWDALRALCNPVYDIAREYADIFPEKNSAELPADRGVRHEIDLVPGSKYCVKRQWPLPRDQVIAIDEFFEGRRKAGHVRESISPHSSPTSVRRKPPAVGALCTPSTS
ncbi:unnamed protein product [Peronospora farinosa]|uniref:Polyprotein n=1 Tax=Peronospora farinosa TaxID=134698 RepID=A0AAV0SP86_9STRA|nr:unnamed protein product [Peronospora farinosa]